MIQSPERDDPSDKDDSTLCQKLWQKLEEVFGNPAIHPCLGYRSHMWHYDRFLASFDDNDKGANPVEPSLDKKKSKNNKSQL